MSVATPFRLMSVARGKDQVRDCEESTASKKKILEFCQLSEKRTVLNPSQVTVLNELEVRCSLVRN